MKINKDKIIRANRVFRGNIHNPSNLDFEIDMANKNNNIYKSLAHTTRAMTSGHAFSDGNKRTAGVVIKSELAEKGIKLDNKKLAKSIVNITKSNEIDLNIIERRIRKAIKK